MNLKLVPLFAIFIILKMFLIQIGLDPKLTETPDTDRD